MQRHFIRLHYFNNRSIKDIAAEQGCSVSNIQQIEQQAFRKLRKNKRLRALNEQLGAIDFVRKFDYYRISPEYCTATLAAHALEKKLLQDSSVSYGQRQAQIFMLLCKAEQDYRQHNQEQGNSG